MNKKKTIKKTAALLLGLGFAFTGAACGFITTDAEADMKQTVANVNITKYLKDDAQYGKFASAVSDILTEGNVTTKIPKRDLISYFLSVGYTYVNSYGYSYKDTFEMLMKMLVNRKIIVQYAMAHYLQKGLTAEDCLAYIESEQSQAATDREKALLKAHPEVSVMKYFLTEGNTDMTAYNKAVYAHKKAINNSIDSIETQIIKAKEETHDHGEVRTTPNKVGAEKEDYVPTVYEVYTGRNSVDNCGEYEAPDNSSTTTRKAAYNNFLANLQANGLIKKGEDVSDFTKIDYYYVELAAQLEQALITKYTDDLNELSYKNLNDEYMQGKYTEMLEKQKETYGSDYSAFETAAGALSDTAFALYSPQENFGMVYNILIPFSATQNNQYTAAKNKGLEGADLYAYRATLLNGVEYKDLRESWFNEHEDENYAYKNGEEWYFFEDNFQKTERYEALVQYAGNYPFRGTVTEETMEAKSGYLGNIDKFIEEFEDYVAAESGVTVSEVTDHEWSYVSDGKYTMDGKDFADYSEFIYYEGKADVGEVTLDNYFAPMIGENENKAYKAVAAVNELMFAYSTDPGCLNTYLGYSVSPNQTSYVPEFEYAAQYAVKKGAGSYVVCATDYGWHLMYVSYVFPKGNVYAGYNHDLREEEGTFSKKFYEYWKSKVSDDTTRKQNDIVLEYNNNKCVKLYKDAYQDLLEID